MQKKNRDKVLTGEQINFEVTTVIAEEVDEQEEKIEKEAKEQNKTQVEHEEENKTEIVSKDENEIKNASEQQQNTTVIPPKLNEPNEEPLPNPFTQQDIDQQNLGSNPSNQKQNTTFTQEQRELQDKYSALNIKAKNMSEESDQDPSKIVKEQHSIVNNKPQNKGLTI